MARDADGREFVSVRAEVASLAGELALIRDRLMENAATIETTGREALPRFFRGTAETVARDLLEDACETLLMLGALTEEGAERRMIEAADLLDSAPKLPPGPLLDRPEAAARYLQARYPEPERETFGVLYLDHWHRLAGEQIVCRGQRWRTSADSRQIARQALERGVASLILWHSCPDEPQLTAEDLAVTARVAEAGEQLGVRVVDHVALGSTGRWVSAARLGKL